MGTRSRRGEWLDRDLSALIRQVVGQPGAAPAASFRVRAFAVLVPVLAARARRAGVVAVAGGRWLTEEVLELAPQVAFRQVTELRRSYPELDDAAIAERLISSAVRTTAGIGAAAGGFAAVQYASPPLLLGAPLQVAAETIAVSAVELRLVAELHEIMGFAPAGSGADIASAYFLAWARRSAADTAGGTSVLSAAAQREVRSQLLRRTGRSATSLAPLLAGAAAGAELNRRATRRLGDVILSDLRRLHDDRWFRRI